MDLLDVSVISAKGYKYILVVCDYFTKYTEAYPLKDKTVRSVADALMDIWLPRVSHCSCIQIRERNSTTL